MEPDLLPLKTVGRAAAGMTAIEAAAYWAIGQNILPPLALTGIARVIGIAFMGWMIAGCPRTWRHLGLERAACGRGLRRGCLWAAGFGLLAVAGFAVLQLAGLDPLGLVRPGPGLARENPVLLFAVGGLVAPVAEELFFRGLLFGGLRRWGFWPAFVLSTVVFTLLHAGAGGVPIVPIVGALVFTLSYEIEKNLLVPIAIHVLGNLSLFSLAYVG